jgi:hypothetical protein
MVSDKTFKVTVIALLVLIFGATIGSMLPDMHNEFVEFEEELVYLEDSRYFLYERHDLESFSERMDTDFMSYDDLIEWAEQEGYEVEITDIIEAYKEECDDWCTYYEIIVDDDIIYVEEEYE